MLLRLLQSIFPHSIFRRFLPKTAGLEEFIEFARRYCKHKVVLKRPYYETSDNPDTKKFKGRSTNFEIFPRIEENQEIKEARS